VYGFPNQQYQPNQRRSPSGPDVGRLLMQQNPEAAMAAGLQPLGTPMGGPQMGDPQMGGMMQAPPDAGMMGGPQMGGPQMGGPAMGDPQMGGMMAGMPAGPSMASGMRMPGALMGDYDPITEHSAASTMVALTNAIRAAQARHRGSERSVTRMGIKEHLLALGIPPIELQAMESTGVLGGE
jgi:hypothetical protein